MCAAQLEERAGRPIHEMFDIIGGTSTGGILATALGVRKASLLEAEEIYRCSSWQCSCPLSSTVAL